MRLVIAEDSVLLRAGLAALLTQHGHEVVAEVGDADALRAAVARQMPDLAVVDVRMPPGYSDEGARAAVDIRRSHPAVGVLVLSQTVAAQQAMTLLSAGGGGVGYLLKDSVLDVADFLDAAQRVARGGSAVDPGVVGTLLRSTGRPGPLGTLSPRERAVLELVAQGRTNTGIARRLHLTERTVESHVRSIFRKLEVPDSGHDHRRVHAVLTYLSHR